MSLLLEKKGLRLVYREIKHQTLLRNNGEKNVDMIYYDILYMFMVVWLYVYWLHLHVCKNDEWRECRDQYIRVMSTFSILTLCLDECDDVTKSIKIELRIKSIKFV